MSTDNLVGRTVAGYHLAKYIGEGGTATVYRAEHAERGESAVKILRPRLAGDPIAVKRFLREAEFGSRVSHPNIVRTYDYGESDGLHYLALEWAKGEPLAVRTVFGAGSSSRRKAEVSGAPRTRSAGCWPRRPKLSVVGTMP